MNVVKTLSYLTVFCSGLHHYQNSYLDDKQARRYDGEYLSWKYTSKEKLELDLKPVNFHAEFKKLY